MEPALRGQSARCSGFSMSCELQSAGALIGLQRDGVPPGKAHEYWPATVAVPKETDCPAVMVVFMAGVVIVPDGGAAGFASSWTNRAFDGTPAESIRKSMYQPGGATFPDDGVVTVRTPPMPLHAGCGAPHQVIVLGQVLLGRVHKIRQQREAQVPVRVAEVVQLELMQQKSHFLAVAQESGHDHDGTGVARDPATEIELG